MRRRRVKARRLEKIIKKNRETHIIQLLYSHTLFGQSHVVFLLAKIKKVKISCVFVPFLSGFAMY